jgi:hypothetical protein
VVTQVEARTSSILQVSIEVGDKWVRAASVSKTFNEDRRLLEYTSRLSVTLVSLTEVAFNISTCQAIHRITTFAPR